MESTKAETSASANQENVTDKHEIDKRNEESFCGLEKEGAALQENVNELKEEFNKLKIDEQDQKPVFNKREGTGGISGQLYEIYLVLLILLYGQTNKNVTHFHLASNLKEAGDFDDVVFSYVYKDFNGEEKFKVTFIQAKHREKMKHISLEELLGKTGKGAFDLKKYFRSFRDIKKHFENDIPTHPIFGRNFSECELVIYTNASFKYGHSEKAYFKELLTEEGCYLNFSGQSNRYLQLSFRDTEEDRIKKFLTNAGESDLDEFRDFLSKLKICFAQPSQSQLKEIIKEKIHSYYGIPGTDVETVFAAVKNKVEEWWKDSNEYLTEKNTFIEDTARISIRFEVQDPVPVFIGREQTLHDLHEILQNGRQSVISQSASVTGLGGIGKTELARKYASEYSSYYDNNVMWINAENYITCSESFRRLAGDKLGIVINNKDGKEKDIVSIISEVYEFFGRHGRKSLFIFDNAESPQVGAAMKENENIKKFLPYGDNKPYILITSRDQQWGAIKSLQLDLFTEEESIEFINKSLYNRQIKLEESEVKMLASKLQYLPLALRQAVAYITTENEISNKFDESYTIRNYLEEFEDKANELLGSAPQDIYDSYAKTVLTTWQVTIEKIKENKTYGMDALLILNVVAFLAPYNIPVVKIFASLMEKKMIRGCVVLLDQYSMVKLQHGEVSIHRLLQQVIRIQLQHEKKAKEILNITLKLFADDISTGCIDHAMYAWDYVQNCNELITKFNSLPLKIIVKLREEIRYYDAHLFGMRIFKLFKVVYGDNHRHTLNVLNLIAVILERLGKYDDALRVYQEVLGKRNEVLGPDHPDTLTTINNLSLVLYNQGNYKDASSLFQQVLCKQQAILNPEHLDILKTMNNYGSVLTSQGKYEESSNLYQDLLCKLKITLGQNHHETLIIMNNLALVLDKQGKYEESSSLYQELLCKRKEILGPDHPDTLNTMTNFTSVLLKQGKYEESSNICQDALSKQKLILGPNHPHTLNTMNSLALALDSLGKYEEASNIYQDVLSKQKQTLTPDHPHTLNTMHNLAAIRNKQQLYEESLNIYQEVLCRLRDIFGHDHPDTLGTMNNLALVLKNQGQYEESLKMHQEVLSKQKKTLGLDNPETLMTMNNLAGVLDDLGKYEDSSDLYQETLCKQTQILGADHPVTLNTEQNLAIVFYKQRKYKEALLLLEKVLNKRKEILGPKHPLTVTTLNNLAFVRETLEKIQ